MSKADGRTYHRTLVCSLCRRVPPVWHVNWRSHSGNFETEAWLCVECLSKLEGWKVEWLGKQPISR